MNKIQITNDSGLASDTKISVIDDDGNEIAIIPRVRSITIDMEVRDSFVAARIEVLMPVTDVKILTDQVEWEEIKPETDPEPDPFPALS